MGAECLDLSRHMALQPVAVGGRSRSDAEHHGNLELEGQRGILPWTGEGLTTRLLWMSGSRTASRCRAGFLNQWQNYRRRKTPPFPHPGRRPLCGWVTTPFSQQGASLSSKPPGGFGLTFSVSWQCCEVHSGFCLCFPQILKSSSWLCQLGSSSDLLYSEALVLSHSRVTRGAVTPAPPLH